MRILYISQYFPPEIGAPAARVSELARHWVGMGHQVTVLTGFPNHPGGVVPPEYRSRLRRLVCREPWEGVDVVRTWLWPLPNRKPLERILNYSSFCASAAVTGSFLPRADAIIATSPQLLVGLAGWWLSLLKRVPLTFEVRDLWPESLSAVGIGRDGSLMHRVLAGIAGFLYRRAERIVVVTPAFKDRLISDWKVPDSKIEIVQNGVEAGVFSPAADGAAVKRELGLVGKFVASYIGTLGMAHGIDTLLDCATLLRERSPDVVFLLAGDGAEREHILQQTRERRLDNVRFIGPQPRERIPALICASDVCLVLLRRSEVFTTVIPTKMLEFMSCARPVVLGVTGQAQRILEEAHGGQCVPPEDAAALADAIAELKDNPALREALGRNARRYIVEQFSRRATAQLYAGVLTRGRTGESRELEAA